MASMYLRMPTLVPGTYFLKICENQQLYSRLQTPCNNIIIIADYEFSAIEVIYFLFYQLYKCTL